MRRLLDRIIEYLDLHDEPLIEPTPRGRLLQNAWLTTGKHLQQALRTYGRQSKQRGGTPRAEN